MIIKPKKLYKKQFIYNHNKIYKNIYINTKQNTNKSILKSKYMK